MDNVARMLRAAPNPGTDRNRARTSLIRKLSNYSPTTNHLAFILNKKRIPPAAGHQQTREGANSDVEIEFVIHAHGWIVIG